MNLSPYLKNFARHARMGVFILCVFVVGYTFGTAQTNTSAQGGTRLPAGAETLFDPLFQAFNMINNQYIETVPQADLVDGAIRGMFEALGDPYSNYIGPEYYAFVSNDLDGSIEGIGVVISETEDTGEIQVINVLPDTPAERSGIRNGDVFHSVDGELVAGLTNLELAARVRGPAGTTVAIIMRRGEELIEFDVPRERIDIPNVEYEVLEGDIAYISMTQFSSLSRQQVEQALIDLNVNNLNGLIFDIRGNSGGYLSAAVEIAGLFIEEGTILIEEFADRSETFKIIEDAAYRIDDNGNQLMYSSNASYAGITVPIVLLVDGRSASASELVAGAWQDNGVLTVIGDVTFGKGTVQTQSGLVNGGGVRLTIARWLTPRGQWISGEGVTPDILVQLPEDYDPATDPDLQLQAAIEFLLLQPVAETE